MRIGLVADVPDQPVMRRIEKIVQSDRQFDDAKAGAKMTARHRDSVDRFGSQLCCKPRKFSFR